MLKDNGVVTSVYVLYKTYSRVCPELVKGATNRQYFTTYSSFLLSNNLGTKKKGRSKP